MIRSITETQDQTKFDESELPSVLHMIGTLLLHARMSSRAVTSTRKALETVLQQARTAAQTDADFAERVARYIVLRISKAIEGLKECHSNDEGVGLILRLEDEVESLSSSIAAEGGGVIELITKRDASKTAAEKASAVVGVAMGTSFRRGASTVSPEKTTDKKDILESLLDKDHASRRMANRKRHQEVQAKMSGVMAGGSEQRVGMESTLVNLQSERAIVAERMEELRLALRQLEEDDAELLEKISGIQQQIQKQYQSRNDQVGKLHLEAVEIEKEMQEEAAIDYLADGLQQYQELLRKAVTDSNLFENCDNMTEFVSSKLGVYLVHVRNYFSSEAECVEFLRLRIKKLEKEINDLVRSALFLCF